MNSKIKLEAAKRLSTLTAADGSSEYSKVVAKFTKVLGKPSSQDDDSASWELKSGFTADLSNTGSMIVGDVNCVPASEPIPTAASSFVAKGKTAKEFFSSLEKQISGTNGRLQDEIDKAQNLIKVATAGQDTLSKLQK